MTAEECPSCGTPMGIDAYCGYCRAEWQKINVSELPTCMTCHKSILEKHYILHDCMAYHKSCLNNTTTMTINKKTYAKLLTSKSQAISKTGKGLTWDQYLTSLIER